MPALHSYSCQTEEDALNEAFQELDEANEEKETEYDDMLVEIGFATAECAITLLDEGTTLEDCIENAVEVIVAVGKYEYAKHKVGEAEEKVTEAQDAYNECMDCNNSDKQP